MEKTLSYKSKCMSCRNWTILNVTFEDNTIRETCTWCQTEHVINAPESTVRSYVADLQEITALYERLRPELKMIQYPGDHIKLNNGEMRS